MRINTNMIVINQVSNSNIVVNKNIENTDKKNLSTETKIKVPIESIKQLGTNEQEIVLLNQETKGILDKSVNILQILRNLRIKSRDDVQSDNKHDTTTNVSISLDNTKLNQENISSVLTVFNEIRAKLGVTQSRLEWIGSNLKALTNNVKTEEVKNRYVSKEIVNSSKLNILI